ncbi:MAG: ABC transporter substrate-binding protein [Actinomycetota bacterium]
MKRSLSIGALAALLLASAACGNDASSSATTAGAASSVPDTTLAPSTAPEVTGDSVPAPAAKAIVSLSPTATEMLFAIGAGDQVIAVDDMSNFPAEALQKPHDLSGFEPNVEAIAALQPDLVILQDTTIQEQLETAGVTVWVGPAATNFEDVYAQISQLGAATGHEAEANALIDTMKAGIEAAVAAAVAGTPAGAEGATFYHELDPTLYSVTSNTFIGQVYGLFGLKNIADDVEPGNDYPQLNAEYVVQQNPALIVLADSKCCGESPETVAARPGWGAIAAVQNGDIVVIDDDIASRWGPRLVDFIQTLSAAVVKALG